MSERPTHPKKELEAVLIAIERGGWRVDKPGKYFRCRCSCGDHMTHVHLTPVEPEARRRATEILQAVRLLGGGAMTDRDTGRHDVMVVVEQSFRVTGHPDPETLHHHAEQVMAELVEMSEKGVVLDSAVSSDTGTKTVHVEVTVAAADVEDGIGKASSAVRTAVHAVGDATPRWPSHADMMEMVTEKVTGHLVEAC